MKIREETEEGQKDGCVDTAVEFVAIEKVTLKENMKEYRIGRGNYLKYVLISICLTEFSLFGEKISLFCFLIK